jgi:hypothetical protein
MFSSIPFSNLFTSLNASLFRSLFGSLFGSLIGLTLLVSPNSMAYLSILESGETVPTSMNRVGFIPQLITSGGSGLNADVTLDTGWNESSSSRFQLGAGKIDIHLGASYKWVPYPDVARQPALGLRGSLWYGRTNDENYTTLSVAPLVSKKYPHRLGLFVPYVALPINYTLNRQRDFFGQQFILGTEFMDHRQPLLTFAGEISLNLKDSYAFIAAFVSYQFDGAKGLPLR